MNDMQCIFMISYIGKIFMIFLYIGKPFLQISHLIVTVIVIVIVIVILLLLLFLLLLILQIKIATRRGMFCGPKISQIKMKMCFFHEIVSMYPLKVQVGGVQTLLVKVGHLRVDGPLSGI